MEQIKEWYFEFDVNAKFMTKSMFYLMHIPMQMGNYTKLRDSAKSKWIDFDNCIGMIESAKAFWFGWIGMESSEGDKEVKGNFIAYEMVWDYKQMKQIYKKIMSDYPNSKNFYNLYRTNPSITPLEKNITYILFQI